MKLTRDQNGHVIRSDIRYVLIGADAMPGWGVTVWFGGVMGPATNIRRYYYQTREQARRGDIGDDIGKRGRVA